MTNTPTMTPEMLTGLLQHLYQEGRAAAEKRAMLQASVWYAQCLSVLRQLPDNAEFMAIVLFNYGQAIAYSDQRPQAIACLEASAVMQKQLGETEAEADCFQVVGQLIAVLGDAPRACKHWSEALRRYNALNLTAKAQAIETEITNLLAQQSPAVRAAALSAPPDETLNFIIAVDKQPVERFSIEPDGRVHWERVVDGPPAAAGLVLQWQVVCTDFPYTFF